MAKLTVYLPDELADQVRSSVPSPSAVCQRALAEAVLGPRVTPRGRGWCRVQVGQAEAMVRFALTDGRTVVVREVVIAADNVTDADLRALALGTLTDWAAGDAGEDIALEVKARETLAGQVGYDRAMRSEAVERIEWGSGDDAVGDLRVRE